VAEPTPKPSAPKPAPATPARSGAPPRPASVAAAKAPARRAFWRRLPGLANQPAALVGVTGLVVLVVVFLVGFGYWDTYIRPGREASVKVGGRTYDMVYFARRMKAQLNDPIAGGASAQQIAALPGRLGKDIVDEEVLIQRASSVGVGVSDDEIDGLLAEKLAIPFTKDENGQIARTPSFANSVRAALQRSGLSVAEYRRAIHGQQLRIATRKYFESQIPKELPAARLRQIAVSDEAKAKELKQQIEAGADFAQLATSVSVDSLTKNQGGLRDWAPKGFLPDEFEQLAFSLPIGQMSEPFKSSDQWVIVRVEERQDNRELTEQERSQLATKRLNDWLESQRLELHAVSYMEKLDRVTYALEHSGARDFIRTRNPSNRSAPPISPGGGSP
jgi:parvulin-like peptidyl-prolyl isomerase